MSRITLDFIGYGGNSVGTIVESDSLRRQVKIREYNALLTVCCIFQLPIWFTFIYLSVSHFIISGLLQSDDIFVGEFDLYQCKRYSLFCNILKGQTGTNLFQETNTCFAFSKLNIMNNHIQTSINLIFFNISQLFRKDTYLQQYCICREMICQRKLRMSHFVQPILGQSL